MKLWKNKETDEEIIEFTVGNDHKLDQQLLHYDCEASKAHAKMLKEIEILDRKEYEQIKKELEKIQDEGLKIEKEDEDCHTAIEKHLTKKLGDTGKKIHTGRSRNDQVMAALRLYEKENLEQIKEYLDIYLDKIEEKIKTKGSTKIPGYTHTRKAMPTTVKNWLGSFKESGQDNKELLELTKKIIDKSPLGTAAGFGVKLSLDKQMVAQELNFSQTTKHPLYVQNTRGKIELQILNCLGQIMLNLNKLATDLITYSTEEYNLIKIPEKFCTGSSIMPHKQNPDVLEIIRAKYSKIKGAQAQISNLCANLMSGYHRDMQLIKQPLFESIKTVKECLYMMTKIIEGIEFKGAECESAITEEMKSVERINEKVKNGTTFRDAYQEEA